MSSIYERFRDAIRAEEPVALATVIEGPDVGAKILVLDTGETLGTLGVLWAVGHAPRSGTRSECVRVGRGPTPRQRG